MKQGINMILLHRTEAVKDQSLVSFSHTDSGLTRFSASVEKQENDIVMVT